MSLGTRTRRLLLFAAWCIAATHSPAAELPAAPRAFIDKHCAGCHDADTKKGGLDLQAMGADLAKPEIFARWMKVYDRVEAGEMPPRKKKRPPAEDLRPMMAWLKASLITAEDARLMSTGRTGLRRLTRAEYENTVRELFDMPGLALQAMLPADGSAHGFDKNSEALSISHVNLAKYIEAAEHTLDLAIATRPTPPAVQKIRTSLVDRGGFTAHITLNGDAVMLRDMKPDPAFPPAGMHHHIDQGAHERMGSFATGSTIGLFRHEDESVSHYFMGHVTVHPGHYRIRTSLWSFQWDKGKVLPARGTEAGRLSVVQLTGDGRGGQHPSYTLGYYAAPPLKPTEHDLTVWLNHNELMGFNPGSLAPVANYNRAGRAMAFTGPGVAVDWLDVEGPLHDVWPPRSHRLLFRDLPLREFVAKEHPGVRPPVRLAIRRLGVGKNRADHVPGLWTVHSTKPQEDADRLLAAFLPKAFRRPVDAAVCKTYVAKCAERLKAGDCFETAMRWVYRAALCSPDFLFHAEPQDHLDDHALACRLSYFLWNSPPDETLSRMVAAGKLKEETVLREQTERLLRDPKSQRFIVDFLGQWLKLRQIAANDADRKLYPEFSPYLQDSMVAETHAYFRELLDKNLDASYLVRSDFVMVNEKLATHYGIRGVSGPEVRRVPLPPECPRGGFLTQASILKITANGTTTSPVPRGAFVMDRLLGQPPEPPPTNVPAVEPDVRGASTIRELLAKHRNSPTCVGCHAKIDPAGFALESFDVIGGFRTRYRSIGEGERAPRGSIDPFIGISFKLGPTVDPSSELPDGRAFGDIRAFQTLIVSERGRLLKNLAGQLAVYATGRGLAFRDRDALADIVTRTEKQGGGIRTLVHELVQSKLFQTR
jgi:hypothetical protein